MRQAKVMVTVGVLLAAASTALALDADALVFDTSEADATVHVQNFEFEDQETDRPITIIEAGETVEWVWQSGCHSVTEGVRGDDATPRFFDSGVVCATFDEDGNPATTFQHTFTEPGVYKYHCQPHFQMEATVVVTGGS